MITTTEQSTTSGRQQVLQQLEDLAKEVADDQEAIDGQCEDTRARVIRMGKRLTKLQKIQKGDQQESKKLGQPVTTWKEWCEAEKGHRVTFPAFTNVKHYTLIAKYPKAYERGMSIKEAYKEAGKWKKNAGNPPIKEKVTITSRPLVTIGAAAARLNDKIKRTTDQGLAKLAKEQKWTEDEVLGATAELTLLWQTCGHLLKELKTIHAAM